MLCPSVVSDARMGGILQKAIKVFADASIRHVRYALLGNNDDVGRGREPGFVKTEELSEPSLQVVPPYRLSHFLADNDSQTRPTLSVGAQEYQEIPGGMPLPPSRGRKEFPSNEESVLFGKGLVRALASLCLQRVAHRVIGAFSGRHQVGDLYAEPLSALGSPTAHDLSSTSRLHTSPKSVRSFSSNRAGLIGTFHGVFLLLSDRARMGLHTDSQFLVLLQLNASESEYVVGESAVYGRQARFR
jgi:hypothetical protein